MPPPEPARRDSAEDAQWSRPECQAWTATLLLGTCLLYCTRVSMPVCAVSMSQDFGWNKKEAGIALSSFFWGYCLTQVVGGHLGDRVGGEKIILLSATAWGVITTATPLLTHLGGAHLVFMTFSRILTGLLQGRAPQPRASVCACMRVLACACSCQGALSMRALVRAPRVVCLTPPCRAGASLPQRRGSALAGALGSEPTHCPEAAMPFWTSRGRTEAKGSTAFPYLADLLEPPVSAISNGTFHPESKQKVPECQAWTATLLLGTCLLYCTRVSMPVCAVSMSQDFGWNKKEAARRALMGSGCEWPCGRAALASSEAPPRPSPQGWVFNVVPWLVAIPASLFSGFLSDHLISQGYRTITVRKFMQVMGLGLSSVFALCLGHTSSFCKSVFFASASIGLQTFNHSGVSVNIQDLAPSCAGVLFGVANTAGALAGVVGVGLSGYLIESTGSWTSMFNLVAAISSLGLCTFLLFGKAQRVDLSPSREDL
ncbi:solute carrier family 17 member 9 [Pteropus vampyrus]|uniref:Solute carrier family 17 member 9 n=1 Tax=Pteropus vampyrus TaxID=132908 RepID=A0A6P3RDS0_PTEVA|nr:solute carrier family 17 member 9 [Pteropus vampyrus]